MLITISALSPAEDLQSEGKAIRHPSLWQRLFGIDVDKENEQLYTQALDTGGVILTLCTKEGDVPQALTILDASGAAAGAGADYAGDTGYGRDVARDGSPAYGVGEDETHRTARTVMWWMRM